MLILFVEKGLVHFCCQSSTATTISTSLSLLITTITTSLSPSLLSSRHCRNHHQTLLQPWRSSRTCSAADPFNLHPVVGHGFSFPIQCDSLQLFRQCAGRQMFKESSVFFIYCIFWTSGDLFFAASHTSIPLFFKKDECFCLRRSERPTIHRGRDAPSLCNKRSCSRR